MKDGKIEIAAVNAFAFMMAVDNPGLINMPYKHFHFSFNNIT